MAFSLLVSLLTITGSGLERCGSDVCPDVLPRGRTPGTNSRLLDQRYTTLERAGKQQYDYIVIGGGGAGCPLARTLADAGRRTLLIERGGARKDHVLTQDIYGSGLVIADEHVSQAVITPLGVRTHLAHVLGGGTATGMAISIEEDDEYFEVLQKLSGENIDLPLFREAFTWVRDRTSQAMPETQPYSTAWRQGLAEQGFHARHGASAMIKTDGTWNGFSLFNATDGYFRNAADVTLGTPGDPQPPALDILLNTTAVRILFDELRSESPRAKCVSLRPTMPADVSTWDSRIARNQLSWWSTVTRSRSWLKGAAQKASAGLRTPEDTMRERIICANREIIVSAGAVNTPLLLARSGVGNRDQLDELEIPPVKEIPMLGKNLIDRALVPVAYFRREDAQPKEELTPQICGVIGLAPVGEDCTGFRMAKRTDHCTMTGAEEITGGRILEGFIYATRILFPPLIRSSPLLEQFVYLANHCSDRVRSNPLCQFIQDGSQCWRKLTATWYFVNEPKSRGYVKLLKNGNVIVDPAYLSHKQDLYDAIRGTTNLVNVANSKAFEGVMEEPTEASCPWLFSRIFTMIGLRLAEFSRRTISEGETTLLLDTFNHPRGAAAAQFGSQASKYEAQIQSTEGMSIQQQWKTHIDEQKSLERLQWAMENPDSEEMKKLWPSDLNLLDEEIRSGEGRTMLVGSKPAYHMRLPAPMIIMGGRKVATFPAVLPDTNNVTDTKQYIYSMMQSMWHLAGTAALGHVVDSQFRVKGLRNLSVVDASALIQISRLNPTQNVVAMGRYAALLKLRDIVP